MTYQIAVLVKQVPDLNAMRIDSATGKPIFGGQMVISSYDDYAIEEAIKLKEALGADVTVIAAGPPGAKDAVSRALAMGADKGILLEIAANDIDTRVLARVLADHLAGGDFDLILTGQSSDDTSTGQVGPQVAEYLGLPSVSSVIGLEANGSTLSLASRHRRRQAKSLGRNAGADHGIEWFERTALSLAQGNHGRQEKTT